jgi:hypothetical protein
MILATVIAVTGVTVKEAVLAEVSVITRDPRGEGAFVIVERPGAFRIERVNQSVAVIINTVAASCITRQTTSTRVGVAIRCGVG